MNDTERGDDSGDCIKVVRAYTTHSKSNAYKRHIALCTAVGILQRLCPLGPAGFQTEPEQVEELGSRPRGPRLGPGPDGARLDPAGD